jgi:hypothetical protein
MALDQSDHNNLSTNNARTMRTVGLVARNNIDITEIKIYITVLIMKQRSELWTNGSELWHNDINIDIPKRRYELTIFNIDITERITL